MSQPPANWYPDSEVPGGMRYWDGSAWTDHRTEPKAAPVAQRATAKRAKRKISGLTLIIGFLGLAVVVVVLAAVLGSSPSSKTSDSEAGVATTGLTCDAAVAKFVNMIDNGPDSIGVDEMRPPAVAAAGRASLTACGPGMNHSSTAGEVDWVVAAGTAGYQRGDFVGDRQAEDLAAALCSIVDRAHDTNVCQSDVLNGIDGN